MRPLFQTLCTRLPCNNGNASLPLPTVEALMAARDNSTYNRDSEPVGSIVEAIKRNRHNVHSFLFLTSLPDLDRWGRLFGERQRAPVGTIRIREIENSTALISLHGCFGACIFPSRNKNRPSLFARRDAGGTWACRQGLRASHPPVHPVSWQALDTSRPRLRRGRGKFFFSSPEQGDSRTSRQLENAPNQHTPMEPCWEPDAAR
jgi:hypothetical protein